MDSGLSSQYYLNLCNILHFHTYLCFIWIVCFLSAFVLVYEFFSRYLYVSHVCALHQRDGKVSENIFLKSFTKLSKHLKGSWLCNGSRSEEAKMAQKSDLIIPGHSRPCMGNRTYYFTFQF